MPRVRSTTPATPVRARAKRTEKPPHPGNPRYDPAQIVAALTASKGMIAAAARMVGCHPDTISDMAKREPMVDAVIRQENELALDLSTLALFTAIQKGDVQAIKFHLKCKGRARGWIEKSDVVLSGGVSLLDLINAGIEDERRAKPAQGHA